MLPTWEDNFSIHNEDIDKQHQILFDLAQRAYTMGNKYISKEQIKEVLTEFFEYMKVHFRDEEQYMEQIGYPKLEEHKLLHKYIIKDMKDTIINIHSVNDMKEKLSVMSKEWLLNHILQEDMEIEKFRVTQFLQKEQKEEGGREEECIAEEEQEPTQFEYICSCPGKIHILSREFHYKIVLEGKNYKCKKCHKPIRAKE